MFSAFRLHQKVFKEIVKINGSHLQEAKSKQENFTFYLLDS